MCCPASSKWTPGTTCVAILHALLHARFLFLVYYRYSGLTRLSSLVSAP